MVIFSTKSILLLSCPFSKYFKTDEGKISGLFPYQSVQLKFCEYKTGVDDRRRQKEFEESWILENCFEGITLRMQ